MQNYLEIIHSWLDAVNNRDAERLISLSDSNVEIAGPRGTVFGHQIFKEWVERAGFSVTSSRTFARGNTFVLAQHAVWRSEESGEVTAEADLASEFRVENGKVVKYARYDSLNEALEKAELSYSDEQ